MKPEMRTKLEEILEELYKFVVGFFDEHGAQPPVLVLLTETNVQRIVDLRDYVEDKELMASMIQAYQNQDEVLGTVFVSEAWVLVVDVNSEEGKRITEGKTPRIAPSDSPDREEVLFFMAETRGGNLAAQAPILRKGNKATIGKLVFSPPPYGGGGEFEGRLIGGTFR